MESGKFKKTGYPGSSGIHQQIQVAVLPGSAARVGTEQVDSRQIVLLCDGHDDAPDFVQCADHSESPSFQQSFQPHYTEDPGGAQWKESESYCCLKLEQWSAQHKGLDPSHACPALLCAAQRPGEYRASKWPPKSFGRLSQAAGSR